MDELYRSKAIRLIEKGIEAATAMESHLGNEQQALVSQDALVLEGMVAEKRLTIDLLAGFEADIIALLASTEAAVASDNWVEVIKRIYPQDQRIDQAVGRLREKISACHELTVQNEGLVNIGLARVSMAMQMLAGDEASGLYAPQGESGNPKRRPRTITHI
jgi:flagellar biosynthesis/type III secretory pathway chaperone